MRILVVEDERKIADALKKGLEPEGYQVTTALSGEEGYFCLTTEEYDLMLLDLMLPGRDGIEILKTIRSKGITTPILLLTGRDTVEDRVLGLDSGADDYLVKPFAFPELLARIRLLLRRGQLEPSWGPWTAYGGAGYWLNRTKPAAGDKNYLQLGGVLQREISKSLTLGAELFHFTRKNADEEHNRTGFNVGTIINLSDEHHILLSVGRDIIGDNRFSAYVAYQLTFGPHEEKK